VYTVIETSVFVRYAKSEFDNLPFRFLKQLKEELDL